MNTELNKVAENLFEKIRSRFDDVSLGDEHAKSTSNPEDARFFNFDFVDNSGNNYGNITISIIDEKSLKIYFSKDLMSSDDTEVKSVWTSFLKELRFFAKRNLLSFEPRDITRHTLKYRDVKNLSKTDDSYTADDIKLGESWSGTKRSSYENRGPVKIIVRHSKPVQSEVRGSRTRNIDSIFLETHTGERFKLPENNIKMARAMARHLSEGGDMRDELGQHIVNIAQECSKLKPFKHAMIRRTFEDSETQQMVEAAFEYYGLLNNTLKKMSGKNGYNEYKENFKSNQPLMDDFNADELKERFVKKVYNDRLENALPVVQKAYNMKKQNKMASQFECWANSIVEDEFNDVDNRVDELTELLSRPLPVGVDGINAINALGEIIVDDELEHNLKELSVTDSESDARDTILNWLETNEYSIYNQVKNSVHDEEHNEVTGSTDAGMDRASVSEEFDHEFDDEESEDRGFFVVVASENSGAFIGMVTKEGSKWRERAIGGKPPYNWGTSYMGYLTPDDVMQWIKKDYGRRADVSGPYYSEEEAREFAEYNYGGNEDIDEGILKALESQQGNKMKPNKKDFNSVSEYYQAMAYYCAEIAETLPAKKANEYYMKAEEYQELADSSNEIDEAKGDIRKALAGAALAGGMALGGQALDKLDQQEYSNSPQLQKLEQLHSQALKLGDSKEARELQQRIENHKARLSLGKGDIQNKSGNPIKVHESVTDILKLAGLK